MLRGPWKRRIFLWLYKDPYRFEDDILSDIFDFYKQTMWNIAVDDLPYKTGITLTVYQKNLKVLLYAFLFFFFFFFFFFLFFLCFFFFFFFVGYMYRTYLSCQKIIKCLKLMRFWGQANNSFLQWLHETHPLRLKISYGWPIRLKRAMKEYVWWFLTCDSDNHIKRCVNEPISVIFQSTLKMESKWRRYHIHNSKVNRHMWPEFELVRDIIAVPVICKFDDDPVKYEGAIVSTTFPPF